MNRLLALIVATTVAAGALAQDKPEPTASAAESKPAAVQEQPTAPAKAAQQKTTPDPMHPRVQLETTLGDIVLELDAERAPVTVDNFIAYAQSGFYNGTVFHRVIKDFMIQGGQFTPTMDQKRAGLRLPIKNEWQNGYQHERGTIAMARSPVADSATAQFFINVVDNTPGNKYDLDTPRDGAGYAIFGKVVEGMDVVDQIRNTAVQSNPKYRAGGPVVPVEPVVIKSAKLVSDYDEARVKKLIAQTATAQEKLAQLGRDEQLKAYIAKTEAETGKKFEKTPSGLMFMIMKEGDGPTPKPTDMVEVVYEGWLLDGTKFDSSIDRGGTTSFRLNMVIKGWTEGVGMMKVGEKRKLLIPPELGYGQRQHPKIPPNSWLVFEVELSNIK